MEKFWKSINFFILLTLVSLLGYGFFIDNIFLEFKPIDYVGYSVLLLAILSQIILTFVSRNKGIKRHVYLSVIFFSVIIHIYFKSTLGRCSEYSKDRNYFYQPCSCVYNPCSLSSEILNDLSRLDSITKVPEISNHIRDWNKASYDEPSLLEVKNEAYRYKLSYSGFTEIVRIERKENKYFAIRKVFNGPAGNPNTNPIISNYELSEQTWDSITQKLVELNFWIHPTSDSCNYLHGSVSIEGYNPKINECTLKNYHAVESNCYGDSIFIKMCDLFKQIK
jgi:hypothetical protein